MAKKAAGKNKSAAIRDYYTANPDAKPKQVAEALAKQGLKVTPAFVSTIRANSKKKTTARRPGRPAGSTKTASSRRTISSSNPDQVSVATLLKVKKLIKEVGSIEEVSAGLSTLKQLQD